MQKCCHTLMDTGFLAENSHTELAVRADEHLDQIPVLNYFNYCQKKP